jgi:hypothetical protein
MLKIIRASMIRGGDVVLLYTGHTQLADAGPPTSASAQPSGWTPAAQIDVLRERRAIEIHTAFDGELSEWAVAARWPAGRACQRSCSPGWRQPPIHLPVVCVAGILDLFRDHNSTRHWQISNLWESGAAVGRHLGSSERVS